METYKPYKWLKSKNSKILSKLEAIRVHESSPVADGGVAGCHKEDVTMPFLPCPMIPQTFNFLVNSLLAAGCAKWKARIFFPEEKLQKEAGREGCLACWPCLLFSTKHVFDVNTFAAKQFGTVVFSLKSLTTRGSAKILRLRIPMHEILLQTFLSCKHWRKTCMKKPIGFRFRVSKSYKIFWRQNTSSCLAASVGNHQLSGSTMA